MKDTQRETTSADALEALSAAQLRSVLCGELESEPVDPARIRRIAAALAAREAETPPDAEQAYRQFLSHYADTEPLYSEAERALALPSEKARPFRRAARLGALLAAILALFMIGTVAASAFGFRIGSANVTMDSDNMVVSSTGGEVTKEPDPFAELRETFVSQGVSDPIVPYYLPEGYVIYNFQTVDTPQGINYFCTFSHPEHRNMLNLHYTLHPTEYTSIYPKDEGTEELYESHGVEHYISSNDGYYRAVWGNDEVLCEIHGVPTREELIKMLESIYEP